jgi:Tfp pilus assembly protein PilE
MITALAVAAATTVQQSDLGFWASITARDIATFASAIATVIVGIVAAVVAVKAYRNQQQETRRQQTAAFYAEAVRAVEDYMECPYRILRKDGSSEARREITQHISDVKSRISFYAGWMAIHGNTQVRGAYDAFVTAAKRDAGPQMTAAWETKPVKKDKDVPLHTSPLPRTATDTARTHLLAVLKADLNRQPPARHTYS